jgi:hypothetical protein
LSRNVGQGSKVRSVSAIIFAAVVVYHWDACEGLVVYQEMYVRLINWIGLLLSRDSYLAAWSLPGCGTEEESLEVIRAILTFFLKEISSALVSYWVIFHLCL